jgi:glycosyltransferase involved in cell wall biosynthesis
LNDFNDRYTLVVAPSSSPHNLINYVFAAAYPGKTFTLISNAGDLAVLPSVAKNLVVVPLYASHWVQPELFQPMPLAQRDVDLIMVANFAKFKRHFALFAALRKMPGNLRVLLIGQDQDGRTAETLLREAGYFGVAGRVTIQSNVSYPGVSEALGRSRASVILSRREGSCVVVAESLFANTPVALLETAEIGSRAFIHGATGRFLQDSNLAQELTQFIERAGDYQARAWAEQSISCFRSTATLNELLRQHAVADGAEWSQDIAPLCWRPDPRHVYPADTERLQSSRSEMKERFGIEVGSAPR